jgi:hypothetical protein
VTSYCFKIYIGMEILLLRFGSAACEMVKMESGHCDTEIQVNCHCIVNIPANIGFDIWK